MKKANDTPITTLLDGTSARELNPASVRTITEAADALDALATAAHEWNAARTKLKATEDNVADIIKKSGTAAVRAIGDRLREEIATRAAADEKYNEDVWENCYKVAAIHKGIPVQPFGLRGWADGSTPIDKPLPYFNGVTASEYPATITDENREAIAAFKPVLKAAPDTSALYVVDTPISAAVRELEVARARCERANAYLTNAYTRYAVATIELEKETTDEAESIEKAVATQNERDAANATK